MRDDIMGRRAPQWLQDIITRRYGTTRYGEPRYRLVWSGAVYDRIGGTWVDWPKELTTAECSDRGRVLRSRARTLDTGVHVPAQIISVTAPHQPIRRVTELRWIRRYPDLETWLIEQWHAPESYGTRDNWYRPHVEGGSMMWSGDRYVPAAGLYPEHGNYEDIGARMSWYPTEHHVTLAIDATEHTASQRKDTPKARVWARMQRAAAEQEKRERAARERMDEILGDADQAFGGSMFIGYGGTKRHSSVELCERAGIGSHPF